MDTQPTQVIMPFGSSQSEVEEALRFVRAVKAANGDDGAVTLYQSPGCEVLQEGQQYVELCFSLVDPTVDPSLLNSILHGGLKHLWVSGDNYAVDDLYVSTKNTVVTIGVTLTLKK